MYPPYTLLMRTHSSSTLSGFPHQIFAVSTVSVSRPRENVNIYYPTASPEAQIGSDHGWHLNKFRTPTTEELAKFAKSLSPEEIKSMHPLVQAQLKKVKGFKIKKPKPVKVEKPKTLWGLELTFEKTEEVIHRVFKSRKLARKAKSNMPEKLGKEVIPFRINISPTGKREMVYCSL